MIVVTLPKSAQKNPAAFARKAKSAGADVLEVRTDLTPHLKKFRSPLPILLAIRGKWLGLGMIEQLQPEWIDFDRTHCDAASQLRKVDRGAKCIVSHHDFKRTPSLLQLQKLVERMLISKPWAVKIATQIVTYKDLVTLLDLQSWLAKKKIRSIVLGMGPKAHLTRVLSPSRNALTYTFLDGDEPSVGGQLPLSFYNSRPGTAALEHRVLKHRGGTAIFGIIGGPQVAHSLSPLIQNALFKKYRVDAVFTMFPTDNFRKTLKELEPLKIAGYCVTAPFKREAYALASVRDPLVETLQSSNTLVRAITPSPSPEGRGETWKAFNTDAAGIIHGYPFLSGCNSVAILGAGGAAAAAIEAVRTLNSASQISVFVRDPKKAREMLRQFEVRICPLSELQNATPDAILCAITPDVSISLPRAAKDAVAIDLRYASISLFMKDAKKNEYQVYDGFPMLIHQALRQFEYFTDQATEKSDAEYLRKVFCLTRP